MTRPMVTVGISFLLATLVASFLAPKIAVYCIIVLAIILVAVVFCSNKKLRFKLVLIIISSIVAMSAYTFKITSQVNEVASLEGKNATITAIITDKFINDKGTNGYEITVIDNNIGGVTRKLKTNMYTATALNVDYYDRIKINVDFLKINSTSSFDTAEYYKQKEIYIFSRTSNAPQEVKSPKTKPIAYYFKQLNNKLCKITDRQLEKSSSGIVKAMVLGDDTDINRLTSHYLSRAGIIHVISISGMHVSFIAVFVLFVVNGFRVSKKKSSIAVIIVVWGFVALTNFGIPTVRAAIMITFLFAGRLFGRPADAVNSLFIAGIIIVLQNPLAIQAIGFLLTFLATLGILIYAKRLSNLIIARFNLSNKFILFVVGIISCTLSATLFMLPVLLISFKGISLISPVSNLIAVPLTPIILVLSIIMMALGAVPFLSPFAYGISELLTLCVDVLLKSAEFFSSLSFAYIGLDYFYVKIWLVVTGLILLITYIFAKKKLFPVLGVSIIGLVVCFLSYQICTANTVFFTTISSYKAQSIVITYRGKSTIVNLSNDGYLNCSIAEFLDNKNIHSIDSYIMLEKNTNAVSDIAYLSKIYDIKNLVIDEQNEINSYCEEYLKKCNIIPLDGRLRCSFAQVAKINVESLSGESAVDINVGGVNVCITNDKELAQELNCEFLFFSQKNVEQAEHFPAKYVILLDECNNENILNNKVFPLDKNRLELSINKRGKYKLKEVR